MLFRSDFGGAQNRLAICCALGHGEVKDAVEAYKWFALAKRHGDNDGADIYAALLKEMTPEQIAEGDKRVKEFTPKN